jgi:predicted phosphodiesterase
MGTKFDVISDTHFDLIPWHFYRSFLRKYEVHIEAKGRPDFLVFAGDIANFKDSAQRTDIVRDLSITAGNPEIIDVPGNHEFWHGPVMPDQVAGRSWKSANGYRIVAGTGWFPDEVAYHYLDRYWCDFKYIGSNKIETKNSIHAAHSSFMEKLLESKPDIVVTHHFPTTSIHPAYAASDTNCYFASLNYDRAIEELNPKVWIHGHTHMPMDYTRSNGTRVYCNPHGYEFEGTNPSFWDSIRLEVDL